MIKDVIEGIPNCLALPLRTVKEANPEVMSVIPPVALQKDILDTTGLCLWIKLFVEEIILQGCYEA